MKHYPIEMTWTDQTTIVVLPILFALVFFIAYWFIAKSSKIKAFFSTKYNEDTASVQHIFFTKISGFILMGVLPVILSIAFIPNCTLENLGLSYRSETTLFSLVWTIGLCIIVIPIAAMSARQPKNWVNYPQIRAKIWTRSIYLKNLIGWALYLIGYEVLFRGVLLLPLVEPLGVWPAIAINTALYSATHIPKGLDETIGALLIGIVLCILTIASSTLWIAIIVHIAMAWTNSLTALKHHPEIHYQP